MSYYETLKELAKRLNLENEKLTQEYKDISTIIQGKADVVAKSWSGSWIGYQANVYYRSFAKPPIDANFSSMDGLISIYSYTKGDWIEYDPENVIDYIEEMAEKPDLTKFNQISTNAITVFEDSKSEILSIFSCLDINRDNFLEDILNQIKEVNIFTKQNFISCWQPRGKLASRDQKAIYSGLRTPPHLQVLSEILSLSTPFIACENLYKLLIRTLKHMDNVNSIIGINPTKVGNIFIGHGGSSAWRDLKDFVSERLNLSYDEFNRVSIAGETNIARLEDMLNNASFAFLVMTAEDEQVDGKQNARQNVIHEVGLFQGRLGFKKAIVLLEEGCEEFSNIQGLGQIRFPKNNIRAVSEDIRAVLEREGLLN